MDFGTAFDFAKRGRKIARNGWNGKDMFVYHVDGNKYPAQQEAIKGEFIDDMVPYHPYLALKAAQGVISTWVPSITDLYAEDWVLVE